MSIAKCGGGRVPQGAGVTAPPPVQQAIKHGLLHKAKVLKTQRVVRRNVCKGEVLQYQVYLLS